MGQQVVKRTKVKDSQELNILDNEGVLQTFKTSKVLDSLKTALDQNPKVSSFEIMGKPISVKAIMDALDAEYVTFDHIKFLSDMGWIMEENEACYPASLDFARLDNGFVIRGKVLSSDEWIVYLQQLTDKGFRHIGIMESSDEDQTLSYED